MSVFGHHDVDGSEKVSEHGGEILNGNDDQFESMKNVYVRVGCSHHHAGGYTTLNGNGGDDGSLNVKHDYVFFGDGRVIEKVNDNNEIPNGKDGF